MHSFLIQAAQPGSEAYHLLQRSIFRFFSFLCCPSGFSEDCRTSDGQGAGHDDYVIAAYLYRVPTKTFHPLSRSLRSNNSLIRYMTDTLQHCCVASIYPLTFHATTEPSWEDLFRDVARDGPGHTEIQQVVVEDGNDVGAPVAEVAMSVCTHQLLRCAHHFLHYTHRLLQILHGPTLRFVMTTIVRAVELDTGARFTGASYTCAGNFGICVSRRKCMRSCLQHVRELFHS